MTTSYQFWIAQAQRYQTAPAPQPVRAYIFVVVNPQGRVLSQHRTAQEADRVRDMCNLTSTGYRAEKYGPVMVRA